MSEFLLTGIGKRIKKLRLEKGTKLTELAQLASISKGLLSKIENGRTIPSLPVLLSIIKTLDIQPKEFFKTLNFSPATRYVHRSAEDLLPVDKEDDSQGFNYKFILDKALEHYSLEAMILEIEPGSKREKVSVDAYEFKYVIDGEIQYQIDNEIIHLKKGDSLFYDGRIPHVPHNNSEEKALMLVLYLYSSTER